MPPSYTAHPPTSPRLLRGSRHTQIVWMSKTVYAGMTTGVSNTTTPVDPGLVWGSVTSALTWEEHWPQPAADGGTTVIDGVIDQHHSRCIRKLQLADCGADNSTTPTHDAENYHVHNNDNNNNESLTTTRSGLRPSPAAPSSAIRPNAYDVLQRTGIGEDSMNSTERWRGVSDPGDSVEEWWRDAREPGLRPETRRSAIGGRNGREREAGCELIVRSGWRGWGDRGGAEAGDGGRVRGHLGVRGGRPVTAPSCGISAAAKHRLLEGCLERRWVASRAVTDHWATAK